MSSSEFSLESHVTSDCSYSDARLLVNGYTRQNYTTSIPIALIQLITEFFWIPYFDNVFDLDCSSSSFMKLITKTTYIKYTKPYWPQELKLFSSVSLLQECVLSLSNKIESLFFGNMMIIMKIIISPPPYRANEIHDLAQIVMALELSFDSYRWVKVENGFESLKMCKAQIHVEC